MQVNPSVNKGIQIATMAGSAVLVLNSAMSLLKAGKNLSLKSAIMPAVSIAVGVSAFTYAMKNPVMIKK